jgi:hypothetical protein
MNEYEVFSKVDFFYVPSRELVAKCLQKRVKACTSQDACEVLVNNVNYLRDDAAHLGLLIMGVKILGAIAVH